MSIHEKLQIIQSKLNAPKGQYNNFGKYSYRNCEDILEALKPLLAETKTIINISDEVALIGERYYIKATASLTDTSELGTISATAYAREEENKKGMDSSQLTGSTSSYARKYALNGLFAIDDNKDADTTNQHGKSNGEPSKKSDTQSKGSLSEAQIKRLYAIANAVGIDADTVKNQVMTKFNKSVKDLNKNEYDLVCNGYESMKK